MKLGYSPTTASILELEQAFRLADELNLAFIELAWELQEIAPQAQPAEQVIELSRATGIGTTLHLPFVDLNLASLIPTARQTAIERVKRSLDYAAKIGASCGVLHSGDNPFYQPIARDYAREAQKQSLAELKDSPVPIALENLALHATDLIREPEDLRAFTDEAGLGNCLDFGHAHVESLQPWRDPKKRGEDLIQRYIDTLDGRVIHLHLHGNDGSADQHLPTNRGTISYQRYISYLRDFPGTICLEIGGNADDVRNSVNHLRTLATAVT